jgi:hypothetical protein
MKTPTGNSQTAVCVRSTGEDEPRQFEVTVQNRRSTTRFHVTMSQVDFERLSQGKSSPEDCVRCAFLFLLDREPTESILRRFDVSIIEQYFPEFVRDFPRYRDAGHQARRP